MKVIYNKLIPFRGFRAINLLGVVFARKGLYPLSERTINHEAIHTAQMKEMLYVFFYLWYVVEWIVRLFQYKNSREAYRNISFEREAYHAEHELHYVKHRKLFTWVKYLRNGLD